MAKLNISFLCLALVSALAASSNADAFGPHRRDHVNLGHVVKKRSPDQATQSTSASSAVTQTTSASSTSVQTTSDHTSASASASPSSSSNGSLLSSVVSDILPTGSSATSAVSTASATSGHSSNTPQTSAQAPTEGPTPSGTQSILYLTMSHTPTPTPTSSDSSSSSSSGMSHAAMTALIVIAALVGAAVIVWTIIRKWKFRPSSDFEGRMQPIDWQPGGAGDDSGHPVQRSLSRASSFHSGSASNHVDDRYAPPLPPIPDHDFTAGPAHLAPVGGYADLARGPSPQPMMQESLGHAPSVNRPVQYDQYGLPLHHGYGGY